MLQRLNQYGNQVRKVDRTYRIAFVSSQGFNVWPYTAELRTAKVPLAEVEGTSTPAVVGPEIN
jgi:hypothetical protein